MLQLLHIENIAVIERADISFRAGFNVLTGETGAGKSIVIDSLGAVLGARTSRDLIRTGAAKAFVSAEFDGVDASLPVLAALGVEPEDGVLLLQRDIYADGKNICRANGRPITVAQLRALADELGTETIIEVDGGISSHNAHEVFGAGADVLVAGNAVFGAEDPQAEIVKMLNA